MLKSMITAVLLVTGAAIWATRVSIAAGPSEGPTTAPSTQPVNKFCAVEHDDPVDPKVTTVYQGKVIGFCCDDCIPKFKANPEKYLKDLK